MLLLGASRPAAATALYAHMEIVTLTDSEEYNPDAASPAERITARTQRRQSWRTTLQVEGIEPGSWPPIQRDFVTQGLDFKEVVWGRNEKLSSAGLPEVAWPAVYSDEQTSWTLLDVNRDKPGGQPPVFKLVKGATATGSGDADYHARFAIEMMRDRPPSSEEFEPAPLTSEPEPTSLTPVRYNLAVGVAGFHVRSSIAGSGPRDSTDGPHGPFESRTRRRNGREGLLEIRQEKPDLPAALVEQFINHPERVPAPINLKGVLTEIEHSSDDADAPVMRRKVTTTTVSLRFETQGDFKPAPLTH